MTTTTTMMMIMTIVKKCLLLQNLQAFLDLDIVVQEIQICCHGGGHPSNVTVEDLHKICCHGGGHPSNVTVEDLHKIGRDGTIRQFADIVNNASGNLIYDVCWVLHAVMRRLMIIMVLFASKLQNKLFSGRRTSNNVLR